MVREYSHYKSLTSMGVDKWKNVTGNNKPEEYKKLLFNCTKNLYDLKGVHEDKNCLIMGLGPSLLNIDKEKYKDHFKLVCNRFYRVPNFYDNEFKPDFWCGCNDWSVLKDPLDRCIESDIAAFVTTPNSMQFEEMLIYLKEKEYLDNVFTWHWDSEILQKLIADKYNTNYCFSRAITIIIEMIAFAFWVGCKSITVAGMDLSYLDSYKKYGMTHAGFDQSEELSRAHEAGGAMALSRASDRNKIIDDLRYFAKLSLDNNISFINASYRENRINIEGFENIQEKRHDTSS